MEIYDTVVIGAGSGGKPLAGELAKAGRRVAVIEMGLVGGECPYLACIPSKAMLLAGDRYRAADPDATGPDDAAFAEAIALRDKAVHHRSDEGAVELMTGEGVEVIRGRAVIRPDHTVEVQPLDDHSGDAGGTDAGSADAGGARLLGWTNLVVATGSEPVVPPIDGLGSVPTWTFDQALSSDELPRRLTVLGGGAVGCELAQVYASFGAEVTLVESADHLLPREAPWVGAKLAEALTELGVDVRTGVTVASTALVDGAVTVTAESGESWTCDRVLIGVGKSPRVKGFGLEELGLEPDGSPLEIDARCRLVVDGHALDDVFAIGDVNGKAPYTHTANYQARTVAAHLLGHGIDADHTGIPRVVYTSPAVLCAGTTAAEAEEDGIAVLTASFDPGETSRANVEKLIHAHADVPSGLELVADASTGVLLGISAIGPGADSWAAELALAVRTRTTVHQLAQALHAFPSWTEAIHPPARELAEKINPPA